MKKHLPWLIVVTLIALAIRLDFLIAANFELEADESIVGLMAKHISEGTNYPIFYYGQHYMGTLEAYCAAALFKVFGISNIALKIVPLFFSILVLICIYFLGLELANPLTARLASMFFACGSSNLIIWSAKARGGFMEVVFLGALALLLFIKWHKQNNKKHFLYFSTFCLGLGWWTNNQVIYFILPISFYLFLNLKFSQFKTYLAAGFYFILGSLPFWYYNFTNHFASFGLFKQARTTSIDDQIYGLFSTALPILIGARRDWDQSSYLPLTTSLAYIIYLSLFAYALYLKRKEILSLLKFGQKFEKENKPFAIIFLFTFCCLGIFTFSSFGWFVYEPRYLLPLYLGIYLVAALAIAHSKFVKFLTSLIICLNLLSCYYQSRPLDKPALIFGQDRMAHGQQHLELVNWLKAHNYNYIKTNYWIGYKIAFETEEQIRFKLFQTPYTARIASYQNENLDQNLPYVLVPTQADYFVQGLECLGISYKRNKLAAYDVLENVDLNLKLHLISNDLFNLQASANNQLLNFANDSNLQTRWSTGHPQSKTDYFRINFTKQIEISGLSYNLGSWQADFPRKLRIFLISEENNNEQKKLILNNNCYQAARYVLDRDSNFPLTFKPQNAKAILFEQFGNDPIFDWSIAEVQVFSNSNAP